MLSAPAGANVNVGGTRAGKTPYDGEHEPGEIVVRIDLPGYGSYEQTVTIEAGKVITISRELVPRR